MSSAVYPLATSSWDDAEHAALSRVIDADRYTMGDEVRAFESEFAAFTGSRHAVMVNSGSSANLLGIAAATLVSKPLLAPGDEVIVPAVSWSTTYYPIHQHGLSMRFVDIDADTLNVDLGSLEDGVTERTRAVFAVNLLGLPNDYERLAGICDRHGLALFEDNCESLGATFGGRQTGTFGRFGTYSSFFSHHISTMEGGVLVTDDEEFYQFVVSLRAHGWTRDLPERNKVYNKTGSDFDDLFRFVLPGYNVRPLEMSGALGREQLKKLDGLIAGRRRNAELFVNRFGDREEIRIQRGPGESSWFGFAMTLRGPLAGRRADVVEIFRARGIECRPIVGGNFVRNPVIDRMQHSIHADLRVADDVHQNGLLVGNHHYPLDEQFDVLDSALSEAI